MGLKKLFFVLLLFATIAHAQKRILTGVVKDSLQNPLVYANIMANPINSDLPFVFSLTDSKGKFDMVLAKKTAYTITVSFMGFQQLQFRIDSLQTQINKKIVLKESIQLLDEVIVTSKTPMKVTQDSIVYDVKEFTNGREFKLKSVMKKLPGVKIDKRGNISIMGKKVSQVFVDNKPFFGGSSKLALDNLPANVISKIQVIKDYNEVAFMNGLTDNQKMIINIKLKEGKKHFTFGDLEAGSNFNKKYLAKAALFYYAPKTNLSYLANANSVGENALSTSDMRRFMPRETKNEATGVRKSSTNLFRKALGNTDFLDKKVLFNALQWQQDLGTKWDFNFYAVNTNKDLQYENTIFNSYYTSPADIEQLTTQEELQEHYTFSKLKVKFKPSISQHIDYALLLNYSTTDKLKSIANTYLLNQKNIDFNSDNSAFVLNQDFNWYRKFNKKNIVKFTANWTNKKQDLNKQWLSNNPILENLLPLVNYSNYNIEQAQTLNTNRFDFLLKYYYKLNAKNHLYFSVGNNLDVDYFYNAVNQITNTTVAYNNFTNDYKLTSSDFYLGLQYRFKLWKTLCTPGVYWHQVTIANSYQNQQRQKQIVLPKFDFEWDTFGTIKINYLMSLQLPNIQKYSYNYVIESFNSLYSGNTALDNALYHNLNFRYNIGSLRYSFYLNLNYTQKINAIKNRYQLTNTDFYLTPYNVSKTTKETNLSFSFSRTRKHININYSPMLSWSKSYDYVANELLENNTLFLIQRLSIGFSDNKIDYNLGIAHSFIKNDIVGIANGLKVNEWSPFADLSYGYKKFTFEMDYNLKFVNAQNDRKNTYHFMNFSLRYGNEDKPWAVSLNAINLFNVTEMKSYSQSAYQYANKYTYLQERILQLKLHYKF